MNDPNDRYQTNSGFMIDSRSTSDQGKIRQNRNVRKLYPLSTKQKSSKADTLLLVDFTF
ncbi:hypothetical protein [Undibacterium sp. RuTC16W]|uniref:hypothetical protein n=1 Tax=Undibacterium sp. RuTC16W TaxID=3413048 RepID=UPI003BF121F8